MHQRRNPRALTLALCLTTLAAFSLGAGCGGDDDKISTQGPGSTTTRPGGSAEGRDDSESVEAAGGESADGGATGGSGTAPSAGSGGAGSSEEPPPPGPGSAEPARPRAPGVYVYDAEGTMSQSGPLGGTSPVPTPQELTVDASDGARQRSTLDGRDSEGDGSITTTVLQYRNDGVYLESLKLQTRVGTMTITYEFVPSSPQLIAPTGVGPGYHTEFSMTSTNGGLKTTTTIDVLNEESVTIGGSGLRTLEVRTHTRVEGDAEGETTSTANFDPSNYLTLVDHTVSDLDTSFGNVKSDSTSTLRSTQPS